jgi:hypothetical protein
LFDVVFTISILRIIIIEAIVAYVADLRSGIHVRSTYQNSKIKSTLLLCRYIKLNIDIVRVILQLNWRLAGDRFIPTYRQNKLDCFNMVNMNDVEENPGCRNINEIVDHTYVVHADFHQGNQSMFRSNAGKQCVAMSLCSIVYNEIKSVNIWDTSIITRF